MSPLLDLRNPGRPIHVGAILFNTLTEHLDVAPLGYFSSISREFLEDLPPDVLPADLKAQAMDFVFHWVTEDGKTPGRLTGNMNVIPTDSFATCPPLDIVILGANDFSHTLTPTETAFLQKSYEDCTALLLVCAGFRPALMAGLLEGKMATAPRVFLNGVREMAPNVNWVEKRYVRDGKIWTTGALLNGFDMVAAFGREMWGGEGSLYHSSGLWRPTRSFYVPVHVSQRLVRNAARGKSDVCLARKAQGEKKHVGEKKRPASNIQSHNNCQSSDQDIVSGLFQPQNEPKQTDEPSQIYDLHRRVFQEQVPERALSDKQNPSGTGAPRGSCSHLVPDGSDMNIGMREADKLLSLFRQRKVYFPFIDIPENTSAPSMAVHQPFLLLAVLTVSSSRMPRLQRRTDERFRRVLSERVIMHGEKSLDYVQGLLVYIAWSPFHLRPLHNQLYQFIQIATAMISDLKLANRGDKVARDTCTGCYYLSSLLATIFRRPLERTVAERLNALVDGQEDIGTQYSRLQMLSQQVTTYRPERPIPDSISKHRWTLDEVVKRFQHDLETFESAFPPDIRNITPTRITKLYLQVEISFLPLKSDLMVRNPASTLLSADTLASASTCFSEVRVFFETFLSIPQDQYLYFSIREWCQLISTISIASQLCLSSLPLKHPPLSGWRRFQASTQAKIRIYLESLAHRMGVLSVSPSPTPVEAHPDLFCMLRSVLEILIPMYQSSCDDITSRSTNSSGDTEHDQVDAQSTTDTNPSTNPTTTSSSRCPVLNGTIRHTDFWQALEHNHGTSFPVSSQEGAENRHGYNLPRYKHGVSSGLDNGTRRRPGSSEMELTMDDLMSNPHDWPSVFSEWVVDLNCLPD
ncbi:hypothetical protein BJX99DRAFT_267450 [Aspergillus californicus]